jgi:hypothetical protein
VPGATRKLDSFERSMFQDSDDMLGLVGDY